MTTKSPPKVWRLDHDGRLSPQARDLDWRVVDGDRGRVDPDVDYLFCAPDFLFPVDGVSRALRLKVELRPVTKRKPARSGDRRD